MKGKKVGVTRGSIQELLLATELGQNGLSSSDAPGKDVQLIYLSYPDLNAALIGKNLDAIMQTEPQHLARLWANTKKYKAMLKGLGLDIWDSETPAVPIVLGSKERVYPFWKALLDKGVFNVMSIAPAVPAGKDLIRTAITAMHTEEQLEQIAEAMAYAVKKL